MERLTMDNGICQMASTEFCLSQKDCYSCPHGRKCFKRLAAYEDTGLEPEEVKEHEAAYIEIMTRTYGPFRQKIGQWLQAEKDGRLVVLPCKKGDTVYIIRSYKRYGSWFRVRCGGDGCPMHPVTNNRQTLKEAAADWSHRPEEGTAKGAEKPKCFYNDNGGDRCLGMAPVDGDEPIERCKRCVFCESGYSVEEGAT